MKTYINIQDIDLMSGIPQTIGSYNSKTKSGCGEQDNQQKESESKYSRWKAFKEKAKNIWGKVKGVIAGVVDVLKTATVFVRTVTGFVKCFRKMKGVFA